jgi:hypothetical protein
VTKLDNLFNFEGDTQTTCDPYYTIELIDTNSDPDFASRVFYDAPTKKIMMKADVSDPEFQYDFIVRIIYTDPSNSQYNSRYDSSQISV